MAQTVKNLPALLETQVQSLYEEDPLEKGVATHSSILAWRILDCIVHGERNPMGYSPRGCRVGHDGASNTFTFHFHSYGPCV